MAQQAAHPADIRRLMVRLLLSGLARSSTGRASDSDSGCCRFKSCRVCCGHCIKAVPQSVNLKVRVRFPLVTLHCRRLTDKPPHYGCGTGGSNPPGSAVCIAQMEESASLRRKRPWVQVPLQIYVRIAKQDKARVFYTRMVKVRILLRTVCSCSVTGKHPALLKPRFGFEFRQEYMTM